MYSVDTLPYSTCIVLPNKYRTVLHSTVLYCTVLYYAYYTVLYMYSVDTLPYSTCIVLPNRYRTVLHSTVLYYTYNTVLYTPYTNTTKIYLLL